MPTAVPHRASSPAHLRVLIVDDDPDVLDVLGSCVAQREHDAVTVSTMREARAALANERFDVLVADVLLPDGDGIELLNEVVRRHAGMRVVVVTGGGNYFGPGFFRPIAEALGAIVLQKPFDPAALVSAVETGESV